MYWSAISTRLLVGIFTPAIRATDFSPVTGQLQGPAFFHVVGYIRKREHDARPLGSLGDRHRWKTIRLDTRLLKDSNSFRQPSLGLSSPFRDLFRRLFG